ncbi:hypothetical protein D910_10087 [Dendroctonus ponderosae]|uniref:Ig-like domain-containing protein n=1 Tax=Dendroctonus ponderosae TaxID=77166 RepID=U4UFL9_DENPD|nr:hypothetical protein D910_10087 [Dendroctonus ponderosae]
MATQAHNEDIGEDNYPELEEIIQFLQIKNPKYQFSAVQIDWSKHNDRLPFNAIDDGHGLLYIRNLSATDSGRYVCRADDGYSVVTESINIVVGGKFPPFPTVPWNQTISPPLIF